MNLVTWESQFNLYPAVAILSWFQWNATTMCKTNITEARSFLLQLARIRPSGLCRFRSNSDY